MSFNPDTGNPNCSWKIEYNGRTMIRDGGKLIYDGPTQDMSPELQKLATEFTEPWGPSPRPAGNTPDASKTETASQ